jgi:hypothetical protein
MASRVFYGYEEDTMVVCRNYRYSESHVQLSITLCHRSRTHKKQNNRRPKASRKISFFGTVLLNFLWLSMADFAKRSEVTVSTMVSQTSCFPVGFGHCVGKRSRQGSTTRTFLHHGIRNQSRGQLRDLFEGTFDEEKLVVS